MRRFAQLRPGFLTDVAPAAPAAPLIGSSAASTSFMFPPALGRRLAASRSDRLLYAVAALMQRRTRTTAASAESTNDLQPTIYIPSSPPPAPPLPFSFLLLLLLWFAQSVISVFFTCLFISLTPACRRHEGV